SPDLNPIENLWAIIKDRLEKETNVSISNWKQTIAKIWNDVSTTEMQNLIHSMPLRLEACIEFKGETIKTKLSKH
ncbi:Transposable element Tcb1 transposase-like protein, partial [Dinothrombium tinctorium]